jgi:TRAP-type C4-dicarboxylate transport system substrate-binding protein
MKKKLVVLGCSIGIIFVVATFFLASPPLVLGKSIELSFGMHPPAKSSPVKGAFLPWTKEIEKRSDGQLKIKIYPSQTLVKARDAYDGVKKGIADIAWVIFSLTQGRFPLISVMELPFLSPSTFVGAHTLHDLYKKFPEIRAELKDVHVLDLWVTLPYEIHTAKKPVRTLDDIKGMKLATLPAARAALEGLGAVPVTMPLPKIYQSVEKGVADGSAIAWGAFNSYKLYEVTKYHINPHLGGVAYGVIMNKKKWNSLPKNLQETMTKVTKEMLPDTLCRAVSDAKDLGIKRAKERNQEIVDLSHTDWEKWKETGRPAWEKWVKAMEAKGLPGRAVLDEAVKLVDKHKKIYMPK